MYCIVNITILYLPGLRKGREKGVRSTSETMYTCHPESTIRFNAASPSTWSHPLIKRQLRYSRLFTRSYTSLDHSLCTLRNRVRPLNFQPNRSNSVLR